jgi:hypothetical protein
LESNKRELKTRYNELINASEDKWEEAKEAFSSASDSFEKGFSEISSLFKKSTIK